MNFRKFNKDATYRIVRHCYRTKNKKGEYNERTNKDIDFSKTPLNYTINGLTMEQFEEKLENYKKTYKVRNKTTVIVGSWVIQKPDFYDGNTKEFFEKCYKIFKSKYPYDLEGFVHLDETTDHMHFTFCPILDGKFNCKKLVDGEELSEMHIWFEKELEKEFGYHIDLVKPETRQRYEMLKELGNDKSIFDYDEKPQYLPMRELKKRTQLKIMQDYANQQKAIELARAESEERIREYKQVADDYKKQNNIDDIIKQKQDFIPKAEVNQMLTELFDALEFDLGKERTKKYRKIAEKFGFVIDKIKSLFKQKGE